MSSKEKIAKEVKMEIMQSVMSGIFTPLQKKENDLNDPTIVLDILFSVLVMTNREVLSRIIIGSKSQIHTKRILKDFFMNVNDEVRKRLSEEAKSTH